MTTRPPAIVLLLSILALAAADEPPTTQPSPSEESERSEGDGADEADEDGDSLFESDRLTGDWCGGRSFLEDRGITIDLGLTTIYQHNARGGVQTKNAHRVSGSYDLELSLDFEAIKLWQGGMLYALAEGSWDDGISDAGYVGDLFGVNGDAGGDRSIDLTELWYEHTFFDGGLRVRAGKLDLGVDFETNAFANDETAQFLNNALINSGNVPFPDNGHGIQFVATPCDWLYFGAGVADAEADARETGFRTAYHGRGDSFSIYEFGLTPRLQTAWGELPGNYRFGLWYDPQPKERFFDDLDGRRRTVPYRRDDVGFYTSIDQVIFRERPDDEGDEQGLGVFVRYSFAHGDVNEIEHFWSAGAQYQGLIPTRDDDVIAFGAAQGLLSEDLRLTGADPHRETVLELYYRAELLPWLSVGPDFQWILRPGGEHGRDAFVAGFRVQAAF
ncbi:MAG: carbohydrate porin [Phycisphaerae bacterium]|jgi:porin